MPARVIAALVEAEEGTGSPGHRTSPNRAAADRKPVGRNPDVEVEFYIIRTLPRPPMFGRRIPGFGWFGYGPRVPRLGTPRDRVIMVVPARPAPGPSDDGLLTVKGRLKASGQPLDPGKSIRPPNVPTGRRRGPGAPRRVGGWSGTSSATPTRS